MKAPQLSPVSITAGKAATLRRFAAEDLRGRKSSADPKP
jgi:hypothetical protein